MAVVSVVIVACGDGTPTGNASCGWDTSRAAVFDEAAPHACLEGNGPRYSLSAVQLRAGSVLRARTVDGRGLEFEANADGSSQKSICTPGGLVTVSGTASDGGAFDVRLTAPNDPADRC